MGGACDGAATKGQGLQFGDPSLTLRMTGLGIRRQKRESVDSRCLDDEAIGGGADEAEGVAGDEGELFDAA